MTDTDVDVEAAAELRLEPTADSWDFPRSSAGIAVLVRYAGGRGLSAERVLLGTGLAADALGTGEVTAAQELRVVRTLHHLLGEVGVEVGECYDAATFGVFGFAMLSSRTVLDAMNVAVRFIELSHAFALPRARVEGSQVVVEVDGAALPLDVRRFLVERDTTAVRTVLDGLVPGGVGADVELSAGHARLTFGVDQLSRPLPERSADRLALAGRLCAEIVDARRRRSGLAQDVRVLITQRLDRGAPMGGVAAALGMTERTLRRRLTVEGAGYQHLLDEVRSSMAAALLGGRATMPVTDVALRLGYADASALAHARRRWESSADS